MRSTDHFSECATDYARFRPRYPPALFAYLAGLTPGHALAWDCGTGNGQAALGLAYNFATVLATDLSTAQLAQAESHPRVAYRARAEGDSQLPSSSVDLVTAAQALHWFDCNAFYGEVRRVLRPAGILAVWCYGLPSISASVDPIVQAFYVETVGPYWPPERYHVEAGYHTLPFPFPELPSPLFEMESPLNLSAFGRYVGTWSAVRRYQSVLHRDPVPALLAALAPAWDAPDAPQLVRWRINLRVGRKPHSAG